MAENSGPKKPKLNRNSDEYKLKRAERYESFRQRLQDTEKARKSYAIKQGFGERLLGSYGLGEEHFREGGFIKGKLGMFAKAMATAEAPLPDMPAPETERQKINPNISTLIDQLDSLLKVAHKVGMVTTDQKNELKSHLSQKARDDEENRMEARNPNAISSITGTNLTPLNDEITTLIEKIKPLQKQIDEKTKEQEVERGPRGFRQRLAESYGFGDDYERYSKRKEAIKAREASRTKPGYKRVMGRDDRVTYRGPSGKFAKATDALVTPKPPSRISRATGATGTGLLNLGRMGAGAVSRGATAVAGSAIGKKVTGAGVSMAGGLSSKISSILGSGFKKANVAASAAKNVSPNVVKRIVQPIITKAIGSTVIKSIPIVGAAAGGLFAAKRLLEGDPVGAGLEAASGLGGPLTAIPAMVASVSRDAYSGIFNTKPEQDPYFSTRMKFISGIVGTLVTAMLASKIESKPKPTRTQIDAATVPSKPPQQMGETPSGTPIAAPPAAPAPSSMPSSMPSSTPSPAPSSTPSSTPSPASKTGRSSKSSSAPPSAPVPPPAPLDITPAQTMINQSLSAGAKLDEISREVEAGVSGPSVVDLRNGGRPMPSTSPPTKRGVSGAGDVPDPNYYGMGVIGSQIQSNPNPVAST